MSLKKKKKLIRFSNLLNWRFQKTRIKKFKSGFINHCMFFFSLKNYISYFFLFAEMIKKLKVGSSIVMTVGGIVGLGFTLGKLLWCVDRKRDGSTCLYKKWLNQMWNNCFLFFFSQILKNKKIKNNMIKNLIISPRVYLF